MNFDSPFEYNTTNYALSDLFFEPQSIYQVGGQVNKCNNQDNQKQVHIVQTLPTNTPPINNKETFANFQDNEKIFLYFIIIILISTIVIMIRDFNSQIIELSRKVVRVI